MEGRCFKGILGQGYMTLPGFIRISRQVTCGAVIVHQSRLYNA